MTTASATPPPDQPLLVSAVITGQPGTGDVLQEMLETLAEATHGEAGCLLYSLQRGTDNRDQFVTVEKWTGHDALAAHLASEHVQSALAGAGEILAAAPMIIPTIPVHAGDPAKNTY